MERWAEIILEPPWLLLGIVSIRFRDSSMSLEKNSRKIMDAFFASSGPTEDQQWLKETALEFCIFRHIAHRDKMCWRCVHAPNSLVTDRE